MKNFKKSTIRWLPCCLIFFVLSCKESKPYKDYIPNKKDSAERSMVIRRAYDSLVVSQKYIHSADLITRTGNDFTSQSLKTLNQRNKIYSHCGIASIEHDTIFVYHALGGEFNPDQKIRRDTYLDFTEPYNNNNAGIFRFSLPDTLLNKVLLATKEAYQKGVMFDMKFDLATDDRMYCAEFVYKTFLKASQKKLVFPLSHINDFQFVGVDDIFLHPLCKSVKELVY